MKVEITYEVEKIERYVVTRRSRTDTPHGRRVGWNCNHEFGVFETEEQAKAVADALERRDSQKFTDGV